MAAMTKDEMVMWCRKATNAQLLAQYDRAVNNLHEAENLKKYYGRTDEDIAYEYEVVRAELRARMDGLKSYYVYNTETDAYLGAVHASSILDAEIKAPKELGITCDAYALTTAPGEPLA